MSSDFLSYTNLIIPVLGFCILVPLLAAAAFEPKGSYSSRVYSAMLFFCAGTLGAEAFSCFLEGRAVGSLWILYQALEFFFFFFLICLCFCWTIYSYYWFHNCAPVRKHYILLLLGPIFETAFLAVSPFNGAVYSIGTDGTYTRGSLFPLFIAACYLGMIVGITAIAVFTMRKDRVNQKQDFSLFLLFFIFPIVGPVIQYLLPDLPLMGITEAVAILTVYISVQQRTTTQYAVERAHYRDEKERFEKSLEEIMAVSSEALCIFHLNLTKNTCSDEHGTSAFVSARLRRNTVDELFHSIGELITEEEDRKRFQSRFTREKLLRDFEKGTRQDEIGYFRMVNDEESHWVKTYLNMLKNPGNEDIEAIVYSVDLDRQEKEEKVIYAITNREYDYIGLIDAETGKIHYQYASQKTGSVVHLQMGDYAEVIRKTLEEIVPDGTAAKHDEALQLERLTGLLQTQEEYSHIIPCLSYAGDVLQKKITYRYLDDKKREILFFISDITEETRQERERAEHLQTTLLEVQHANEMKTEFLSNLSHDMRTPLNAVLGYTNLAKEAADPVQIKGYLGSIEKAGRIMLSLINDTLDLSRIETGQILLKPAPVRTDDLIQKILSAIQPSIDEKHLHLVVERSEAVMTAVNADALRLQEIFINLLSNAVKFTPEGGTITLIIASTAERAHRLHYKVIVRDTGCGMSREFLWKIFEPFTQERQESTADIGGSGLGLSIVKKLVTIMGGTITVKSELGKGTEFTVNLDFEQAGDPKAEQTQGAEPPEELAGKHVLLVEDNAMNTEIAAAVLRHSGIEVTCAANGQAACETFAASQPWTYDVILMDIRMPVMNGHEACRMIRAMQRPDAGKIPIYAMSADAFDDDIKTSLQAGMNGHIPKPINPELLYRKLAAAFREREQAETIKDNKETESDEK